RRGSVRVLPNRFANRARDIPLACGEVAEQAPIEPRVSAEPGERARHVEIVGGNRAGARGLRAGREIGEERGAEGGPPFASAFLEGALDGRNQGGAVDG